MKWLRGFKVAWTFGFLAIWTSPPVVAAPPTVQLGVKAVDELLDDFEMIGEAVGQPGLKGIAEYGLGQVTQGDGLAGIDRTKPLGGYWAMNQANPDDMGTFVAYLPVSDAAALKKLLKKFAPDLKDAGGQWTMTVHGTPVFGKLKDNYLLVSSTKEGLSDIPDLKKLMVTDRDISLEVNLANIPEQLKSVFLSSAEQGARGAADSKPKSESEAQEKLQAVLLDKFLGWLKSLVNDGDRFAVSLNINADKRMFSYDVALSGKANTPLAQALTAYGKIKPAFAAVAAEDAPMSMLISIPTSGIVDLTDEAFAVVREGMEEAIDNDEKLKDDADKKAATDVGNRVIGLIEATVKSGTLQSVVVLDEGDEETVRVIAGHNLAKGEDAGKLVDDLLALEKENSDVAKVKADVAKHAGARIHSVEPEMSERDVEMLGDNPWHFAIRPDSIWVSAGGGNLDALKKSLDASGKKSTNTVAPISIRVKPAQLVKLLETDDQGLIQRAEGIAGEAGDKLILELAPTDKGGVKLHLEFGIDLFKLGAN